MKRCGYFPAMTAVLIVTIFGSGYSQETIAIRADRMINVVTGEVLHDPVIVVEGDRIVSAGQGKVPRGAEVVDLGDMTLLPGFIDMHTHITSELSGNWVIAPRYRNGGRRRSQGCKICKKDGHGRFYDHP